jgi:hypothetical protein
MEDEVPVPDMGVLVQVVDPVCIEQGGSPFDAVDFISFFQEEFGQVGTVLSGDTGNEGFFCHGFLPWCEYGV